jgi:hypothetical protein
LPKAVTRGPNHRLRFRMRSGETGAAPAAIDPGVPVIPRADVLPDKLEIAMVNAL